MREADIQRAIIDHLQALGYLVLRLNAGGYRGRTQLLPPGTPDLLALGDKGAAIWLEVKAEDGRLSDAQTVWHERMRGRGHRVAVVRSVDDVVKLL